jgi:hypothetical protein
MIAIKVAHKNGDATLKLHRRIHTIYHFKTLTDKTF